MHTSIVNFRLKDLTHAQYAAICEHIAPAFAAVPGLLHKVWLSDPTANRYGGVYTWRDRAAFQAFAEGELGRAAMSNPKFEEVVIRDFAVLEGPTRTTRGLV